MLRIQCCAVAAGCKTSYMAGEVPGERERGAEAAQDVTGCGVWVVQAGRQMASARLRPIRRRAQWPLMHRERLLTVAASRIESGLRVEL